MEKVILFYPKDDRDMHWFPFPLMVVASVLKAGGFEPMIIDQRVDENWRQNLEENLDSCLFVGLSVMSGPTVKHALRVTRYIKEIRPLIPTVFGGWHASLLPQQTVRHPLVDFAYIGAAEQEILAFAHALKRKDGSLGGLSRVASKGTVQNPKFKAYGEVHKYDAYWRAGYDCLPDINLYRSDNNVAGFFMARSCPYNCAFCALTKMYRYKQRNSKYIIEELKYLVEEHGFANIELHDGLNFLGREILTIWEQILAEGLRFEWSGKARSDSFKKYTATDMELFKKAGFRMAECGFESGSDRILKQLNKRCNAQAAVETVRLLKEWDVDVFGSFMSGIPGETIEDLKLSIDLIEKLNAIHDKFFFSMNFYCPVPGSKTYTEIIEAGFVPVDSLEGWAHVGYDKTKRFPWMSPKEFDRYMALFHSYFGEADYFGSKKREWASWKHKGENQTRRAAASASQM